MKRAALGTLAAAAVAVGLVALAGATQNRPDPPPAAAATLITLEVRAKGQAPLAAARALVAACRGTVAAELADPRAAERSEVVVEARPALGPHGTRRLAGCLQDATLDRISARILSSRDVGPAPAARTQRIPRESDGIEHPTSQRWVV